MKVEWEIYRKVEQIIEMADKKIEIFNAIIEKNDKIIEKVDKKIEIQWPIIKIFRSHKKTVESFIKFYGSFNEIFSLNTKFYASLSTKLLHKE